MQPRWSRCNRAVTRPHWLRHNGCDGRRRWQGSPKAAQSRRLAARKQDNWGRLQFVCTRKEWRPCRVCKQSERVLIYVTIRCVSVFRPDSLGMSDCCLLPSRLRWNTYGMVCFPS